MMPAFAGAAGSASARSRKRRPDPVDSRRPGTQQAYAQSISSRRPDCRGCHRCHPRRLDPADRAAYRPSARAGQPGPGAGRPGARHRARRPRRPRSGRPRRRHRDQAATPARWWRASTAPTSPARRCSTPPPTCRRRSSSRSTSCSRSCSTAIIGLKLLGDKGKADSLAEDPEVQKLIERGTRPRRSARSSVTRDLERACHRRRHPGALRAEAEGQAAAGRGARHAISW